MKNLLIAGACALALAACGKPAPVDTVDSLAANPERLQALRAQCQANDAKVGDALCNRVAQATRRRFMDGGKSPYANDPVPPVAPPVSADTPKH